MPVSIVVKTPPMGPLPSHARVTEREDGSFLYEQYIGLTMAQREANYYDDSDFYAVVFEPAKDTFIEILAWSTRYAGGYFVQVDAPADLVERMKVEGSPQQKVLRAMQEARREVEAKKPTVGKVVKASRTFKVKGQAYEKGSMFEVVWYGESGYGYKNMRVGLVPAVHGGERVFTAASNVEVTGLEVAD